MPTIEYMVMKRAGQWWVVRDGERSGPFVSEQVAVNAAVERARMDFKEGHPARVSADAPDRGLTVVYDSNPSASG